MCFIPFLPGCTAGAFLQETKTTRILLIKEYENRIRQMDRLIAGTDDVFLLGFYANARRGFEMRIEKLLGGK